jgi:hypothetical protein
MKLYELVRGGETVATLTCHEIEHGKSPFLCMVRNDKHELVASIYLGQGILAREAAQNKSLAPEK